ncbi:uncharacterized protein LOC131370916 [Hemibagrus wyckioides]|uniref:uncharacterized protein LOC131370916 n=1 Tax=Hemibagrus wyckioides TaxID=337641 RepID=UPI00266B51B6|nr:uncharacterized protein LOC131370916 [Hemibagrus wyckioides]
MKMMMKMMKKKLMKMMLFVSFLLLLSHFSASFPLKGCVCEPAGNTTNTTRLINMLQIIRNKDRSWVNLTCVCLHDCGRVVQLDVSDSVIQVKESEGEILEDECVKLVKDLSVMEEPGEVPVLSVVIPLVGASVFISLLLLSLSVINKQGSQVGGVLGSLIHYPPHSLENTMKQESLLRPETKTLI